ncbi:MAG: esterase-like activity of phytase family protein [Gammaproteobacteria bacterium]|nr:esterase-like activity of phytase family protein [Gammaproteobacteria bacterium]
MKHFLKIAGMIAGILSAGLHSDPVLAQTELETRQVALSQNIKIGDRIGRIRFLGMLELPDITRNGVRLSQLSGLAWDDDDGILYAISDKGGLFHLRPEFDGDFLSGVKLARAVPLPELGSSKPLKWSRADAEGLDILNGRNGRKGDAELIISFERTPRIVRYHPDGHAIGEYPLPEPLNDAKNYVNTNKMLESVCVDPSLGIITAPEEPLKNEQSGYTHLFSLSSKSWRYPIAPGDRLTAMECLGQGEVILLQQTYLHAFGQISVTLKRVRLTSGPSSEPLNPETLVTLDSQQGFQIDNFEGLARHRGNRFFMVSDNNDLFVQRTLLMYFELLDQ